MSYTTTEYILAAFGGACAGYIIYVIMKFLLKKKAHIDLSESEGETKKEEGKENESNTSV